MKGFANLFLPQNRYFVPEKPNATYIGVNCTLPPLTTRQRRWLSEFTRRQYARPIGEIVDNMHVRKSQATRDVGRSVKARLVQLDREATTRRERAGCPLRERAEQAEPVGAAIKRERRFVLHHFRRQAAQHARGNVGRIAYHQ